MKIEQQFHEPETTKDRQPYRLRIEAKDGSVIEIVEQMTGGFCITGSHHSAIVITPVTPNRIIVEAK